MEYPYEIQKLINNLQRLPGIGYRNAERLALYIVEKFDFSDTKEFSEILLSCAKNLKKCNHCGNLTTKDLCDICTDTTRDKALICVVHNIKDLVAIEKTNTYTGLYHVLGGYLSPIDGVSIEDLNIIELLHRIKNSKVEIKELILAVNSDLEGETIAQYIKSLLEDVDIMITRLATGISVGGNLTYADERTLSVALKARNKI